MLKKIISSSIVNLLLHICFCIILGVAFSVTLDYDLKGLAYIFEEVLDLEIEVFYFIFYILSLTITYNLLKIKKTKLNRLIYIFFNVIILAIASEIFKYDNVEVLIGLSILNLIFVFKEISNVLDKILSEDGNNNFYKIIIFLLFIIAMSLLKVAIK